MNASRLKRLATAVPAGHDDNVKAFLIVLGCLFLSVVSRAEEGIPDPRDHHYDFAHKTLVAAMETGDEFLAKLKKKKEAYLRELWRDAGDGARDGKKVSAKGLAYEIFEVDGGKTVVVVTLPEAEQTAEAHLVGCVIIKGKAPEMVYTLEKGFGGRNVMGSWNDGTHGNYGAGPEAKPELFRDAILKMNK